MVGSSICRISALNMFEIDLCFFLTVFKMESKSRSDLSELRVGQSTIEDIMSRAYDSFDIQLSSIQLLYSKHGKYSWK